MFKPDSKYIALAGDASTRRYWRDTQKKQILCHEPNLSNQEEFLVIAKLFKDHGISSPQIISVDTKEQTYLQDDLGDTTLLTELVINKSCELKTYKRAIDQLVKIQEIKNIPDFVSTRFFDKEKFNFEVDMTLNYFAQQILDSSQIKIQQTRDEFSKIIDQLVIGEKFLVHRDYHSRNIMAHNNKLYIIDFQDARMGIPQYDLASLLDDCYYQISLENRDKLLGYYYEIAYQKKIVTDIYDDFKIKYDYMVLQRVFKAIGSFAYIFKDKSNPRYLKYIGFAVEKIRLLSSRLDIDLKILEDYYAN